MNAPKTPGTGPDNGTPRGSLIERAADAYGLNDFARRAPKPDPFAEPRFHAPVPTLVQAPAAAPVPGQRTSWLIDDPEPTKAPIAEKKGKAAPEPAAAPVATDDPEPEPDVEAAQPAPAAPQMATPAPIAAEPLPLAPAATVVAVAPVSAQVRVVPDKLSAVSAGGTARIDRKLLADAGMIVPGAPVGVLAEEFRLVKRQLLLTARALKGDATKARTILICSARPDEGKTFCAINLGISLAAERDTEVLLIDGDFAKRDLMPRLGLKNEAGFLDALADPALDPEGLVVRTDVPQLSLLGAGTRNNDDTELLASDRTRAVIERLLAADPKRIVLFDSPPALAASPASVFALHAGQVMMVVRADATGDSEIREAVALLDGCDHIQLVLNQVRHQAGDYRFGDYYTPTEDVK